jgi:hypothetical protein
MSVTVGVAIGATVVSSCYGCRIRESGHYGAVTPTTPNPCGSCS